MPQTQHLLFDFRDTGSVGDWRIINDTVMGGVSSSRFEATEDGAAFTGKVSLDRGGGFVSMRSPKGSYDLSGSDGLRIWMRGSDKTFQLTVYTEPGGRVSYRAPFTPPSTADWEAVDVFFDDLTPFVRGRHVPDAPAFDPARIRAVGILLGDEQDGNFRLELQRMAALGA
jgi:monofunctional biosynthetic peptidoglycan transglycosylase